MRRREEKREGGRGEKERERERARDGREQRTMIGSTALIFLTWFSLSSKMLMEMPDCWPHRRHMRLDSRVSIPRSLGLVVAPRAARPLAQPSRDATSRTRAPPLALCVSCSTAPSPLLLRARTFPLVSLLPAPCFLPYLSAPYPRESRKARRESVVE